MVQEDLENQSFWKKHWRKGLITIGTLALVTYISCPKKTADYDTSSKSPTVASSSVQVEEPVRVATQPPPEPISQEPKQLEQIVKQEPQIKPTPKTQPAVVLQVVEIKKEEPKLSEYERKVNIVMEQHALSEDNLYAFYPPQRKFVATSLEVRVDYGKPNTIHEIINGRELSQKIVELGNVEVSQKYHEDPNRIEGKHSYSIIHPFPKEALEVTTKSYGGLNFFSESDNTYNPLIKLKEGFDVRTLEGIAFFNELDPSGTINIVSGFYSGSDEETLKHVPISYTPETPGGKKPKNPHWDPHRGHERRDGKEKNSNHKCK
ncbi:hypothetical protein GOV05_02400 [Candidatus Woesearchaeota archaeon]|nr:hypothetical protein [Candidatus Woesearchaeota archaeon]